MIVVVMMVITFGCLLILALTKGGRAASTNSDADPRVNALIGDSSTSGDPADGSGCDASDGGADGGSCD